MAGSYVLIAACFFIPLSTSLMGLFAALVVLFWLGSGNFKDIGALFKSSPISAASILLFLVFIAGLFYSPASLEEGIDALKKYRELIYFPIVMSSALHHRKNAAMAINAFFLGCIVSLLASYGMFLDLIPSERYGHGITYHITHSFFMAILAFWLFHKVFSSKAKLWLWFPLLLLTVSNIIFIAPGRTGMIAFLLLMLLFCCQKFAWKQLMFAFVFFALAITVFVYSSKNFSGRLQEAFHEIQTYEHGSSRTSLGMRFDWWQGSVALIQQKPFWGHGTGSFTQEHDRLIKGSNTKATDNPHNEYLFIAVQLGVLGLLLFLGLFAGGWYTSLQLDKQRRWLVQGVILSMAAGCLMNSFLFDSHQGHYFAFLSGLLLLPTSLKT